MPESEHPPKPAKKKGDWATARQHLLTLEKPALLALLKDLYDASAPNRDFIRARCRAEDAGGEVLEKYRKRIVDQFFPLRGYGNPKLSEARKAIRDYRKATGNIPGTAELLMTYVENATEFTRNYGDINLPFYNSVCSVLGELDALIRDDPKEMYPKFEQRLIQVDSMASDIGWGFGDYVAEVVGALEDEFGNNPRSEDE